MKIVVTGGAGFVGSNLAKSLLKKGEEVIILDSLSRAGSEINLEKLKQEFPRVDFRKRDIEEFPEIISSEKPDLVYHLAAQVAVTTSVESPIRDFLINADGTMRIAMAAGRLDIPVIYTSTNKVFGNNVNKVPLEELATRYDFSGDLKEKGISDSFPIDADYHTPYGCSKLVGDIYVREMGGVANRCSCMYGPNQHGISDQGWVAFFAENKILGRTQKIQGDGKQVRDLLHINDVVNLLELEAENIDKIRGEAFAVGGGYDRTISLNELCDQWGIENKTYGDWRPADQKVFYCDTSKAREVLGWRPKVSLNQGLENIYSWTTKHLKETGKYT